RYRIVWIDSGHRVIRRWIVWLDSGHRVTRYDSGHWVIRLNHGRQDLRRQAHRFGYWQDGTGWKEFSLFSGFNYWSTASKRRSANEWSS
ncbi:unnamed protein product, partial [Staurois parvus]